MGACAVETDVGQARGAIIDGRVAAPSDVAATVATFMEGTLDCTGTLVNARVVVTAAHCLVEDSWEALLSPSSLAVVVGAVDPTMATEEQTYAASRVWVAPLFPGEELTDVGLYDEHDIGVIVLARGVTTVTPMSILAMDDVDAELTDRRMMNIAGYGVTDRRGGGDNTQLHVGELPFIERSERELIAGDPGGTDTCDGDSGGPAWIETTAGPRLVGVNSRAVDSERLVCDTGSVFTLASAYASLIEGVVGEDVTGDGVVDTPIDGEPPPSGPAPSTRDGGCTAAGARIPTAPVAIVLLWMIFVGRRKPISRSASRRRVKIDANRSY